MYNDIYETFDDEQFRYHYPLNFDTRRKDYLKPLDFPIVTWDFEDTIKISFKISPEYREYVINITVYNFRFEQVYEVSETPQEHDVVQLVIDSNLSKTVFRKGLYYCRLQAVRQIDGEEDHEELITIMSANQCGFQIK